MKRAFKAIGVLLLLSACATAPAPRGVSDPHEAQNRRTHEANITFDKLVFGPASEGYGEVVPEPVRRSVSNFSANTDLPAQVVNKLLQGNIEDAVHNSIRFIFNSTLGLGGLFDPATDIGLEERGTDFGETLHVWGFAEGDYVVLPFFGPSTERDAFGTAVDFVINPLSYALPAPESYTPTAAYLLSKFNDRYTFGATLDALMYESEDSYVTMRLYYLDNRRYTLGQESGGEDLYDIYDEYNQ